MRPILSDAAEADLEQIADFIAEDNPMVAAGFTRELWAACEGLLEYPERFPLIRAGHSGDLRQRIFANYRIVYLAGPKAVRIIRILHSARDYERILFPED